MPTAYQYTGISDAGVPSFKGSATCDTVNCSRGASLSQLNLRVSKTVHIYQHVNAELIADFFNLTNAINPAFNIGAAAVGALNTGTLASHAPNPVFMKPNAFAGDSGQPEQRVAQLGFRLTSKSVSSFQLPAFWAPEPSGFGAFCYRAVHRFEYSLVIMPNMAGRSAACTLSVLTPDHCSQPEDAERGSNDGGPILPPRQTLCAVAEMPIPDPKNLSADGPAIADEHGAEHSHD